MFRVSILQKALSFLLLLGIIFIPVSMGFGQELSAPTSMTLSSQSGISKRPEFEVATIKPVDPQGRGSFGFSSHSDGKLTIGAATLKRLMYYAFDLPEFQILGGPAWLDQDQYDVVALSSVISNSTSSPQTGSRSVPSAEQQKMLQTLLISRFNLKFHKIIKERPVYLLVKGPRELQLKDAADKDRRPVAGVFMKGNIADGEAAGINVTISFLAKQLSRDLDRPIIDQTGLKGSYDFHLPPSDPSNHEISVAIFDCMLRLGLKLKRGKFPIEMLVIDGVSRPTEN